MKKIILLLVGFCFNLNSAEVEVKKQSELTLSAFQKNHSINNNKISCYQIFLANKKRMLTKDDIDPKDLEDLNDLIPNTLTFVEIVATDYPDSFLQCNLPFTKNLNLYGGIVGNKKLKPNQFPKYLPMTVFRNIQESNRIKIKSHNLRTEDDELIDVEFDLTVNQEHPIAKEYVGSCITITKLLTMKFEKYERFIKNSNKENEPNNYKKK